jgi:hypothetical protein
MAAECPKAPLDCSAVPKRDQRERRRLVARLDKPAALPPDRRKNAVRRPARAPIQTRRNPVWAQCASQRGASQWRCAYARAMLRLLIVSIALSPGGGAGRCSPGLRRSSDQRGAMHRACQHSQACARLRADRDRPRFHVRASNATGARAGRSPTPGCDIVHAHADHSAVRHCDSSSAAQSAASALSGGTLPPTRSGFSPNFAIR